MKKTWSINIFSRVKHHHTLLCQNIGKRSARAISLSIIGIFVLGSFFTFAEVGYKAEAYVPTYSLYKNAVVRLTTSSNEALPYAQTDDNSHYLIGKTYRFTVTNTSHATLPSASEQKGVKDINFGATAAYLPGIHLDMAFTINARREQGTHNTFINALLNNDDLSYIQEENQCPPSEIENSLLVFSHRHASSSPVLSLFATPSHYQSLATRYGNKYNLPPDLIMAIMKTESNFNPHAVSSQQAIGLMQVVPTTAGEEVYSYLYGYAATPSTETLFHPENNILYGTTYLHLLNKRYFHKITNETSRQLCMIAAYNGGPGAVLRVFSNNMDTAAKRINAMTPDEVYTALSTGMPFAESRHYIDLVLRHVRNF